MELEYGGDYLDTRGMCELSHTLERLLMWFEFGEVSILDYKLYIDDSQTPIILTTEADYQPYLDYHPLYIIEDATFDNIRYTKAIRLITPKTIYAKPST